MYEWVYYIPTPPYKPDFMMIFLNYSEIYKHIGPNNKAMVTLLQFILSKEMRKEAKPQGENPPSRRTWKAILKMLNCWCCCCSKLNVDVWRNLILGKKRNLLTWIKKHARWILGPCRTTEIQWYESNTENLETCN